MTANLVLTRLKVDPQWIIPLALDERINLTKLLEERKVTLKDYFVSKNFEKEVIFVTLIDANHCPGSVCFLFEIQRQQGDCKRILHTGDFRCSQSFLSHPVLSCFKRGHPSARLLDLVYLDTTYSDPKYQFPSQQSILESLSDWTRRILMTENRLKLVPFQYLLVIGRYTIGKEKIYLRLLETFPKAKVYFHPPFPVSDILNAFQWPQAFYKERLELRDHKNAMIHIVPMNWCQDAQKLSIILQEAKPAFTHLISIKPTGWTFSPTQVSSTAASHPSTSIRNSNLAALYPLPLASSLSMLPFNFLQAGELTKKKDRIFSLAVPYSEHSSYDELVHFCQTFNIQKWIPTVPMETSSALFRDASQQEPLVLTSR